MAPSWADAVYWAGIDAGLGLVLTWVFLFLIEDFREARQRGKARKGVSHGRD